jgi:Sulfotransferase domain
MRWNFSSRARELSGADAVVISIPKSGRTWTRTFLNAYFAYKNGKQFSIDVVDRGEAGVPRIIFSHDRFEHRTKGNAWDRVRGKYLIPDRSLRHARIVLLVRDPRDAFVSYFVQVTRRNPATPPEIKALPIHELLRHPQFGIAAMVEVMNGWLEEFGDRSDFSIARYEELRADPPRGFHQLLRAIGEKEIDDTVFGPALDFSDFRNMQKLEAAGEFRSKILQPRNPDDLETFKVRQGKVGGFREYLSVEDQEYAAQVCTGLNPRFGYASWS